MSDERTARRAPAGLEPSAFGVLRSQPYLLALLLLAIAAAVNYALQPNFFRPAVLSGNLRTFLPLMLLAAGQAIVIIGGGVDLSVGAIVSLANVVMVQAIGGSQDPSVVLPAAALGLLAGALAGAANGLCVAVLRFQPIVTTFATSFVFSGVALWVQPSPGGSVPVEAMSAYTANPLGLPMALWVAAAVLLLWAALKATRYGPYLYAVGGQPLSAYVSGVPVALVRLSTYVISGTMAAAGAVALVLSTGSGSPLVGGPLTLSSIVAVVLGGTRLSGGQGGVAGALIGVVILGLIRSIISFANVSTWYQTLVDGLIVMLALAGPGLVALVRRRSGQRPVLREEI
jgi:ribose transport system permease protein